MKALSTLLFFVFACTLGLYGQATLSIQGTIQKSFGGAVDDGKYSLTFKLYTGESGGTPVWSETQDGVEVIGGVYSALLGAANPLNAGFNTVYYLGIAVDGGQELTPRTRLTSAPYALSLIGQSNTFPSAGAVGVGTVTPDEGTKLHVHSAEGSAQATISSASVDDHTILRLKSGENWGEVSVEGGNGNFNLSGKGNVQLYPAGKAVLYTAGLERASTDSSGFYVMGRQDIRAGNGQTNPYLAIRSGNYVTWLRQLGNGTGELLFPVAANIIPQGRMHIYGEGGLRAYTDTEGWVVNGRLHATGRVVCSTIEFHSDSRIKKDLKQSLGANDLSTLMNIQVTDYRHVDSLTKGKEVVKGFVAQQVEQVFPQAVSQSAGYLPDLLAKPIAVSVSGNEATLQLDKPHGLTPGSRVKIMLDENSREMSVLRVADAYSFTVGDWRDDNKGKDILVYGKETQDFHTVDYSKIYTLNVSATQELARRVAQLEAENAALRQKNGVVEQQNQSLRSDLNGLNARLSKLESLLISNANR